MPQVPGLVVEDLRVSDQWVDPTRAALKEQLIEKLRLDPNMRIEKLQGRHGGLNMGIWIVQDASRRLVLKLVTCTRFMGFPTEAERLLHLAQTIPEVIQDRDLAFPIGIFKVVSSDQSARNLIVMEKVGGEALADIIAQKSRSGRGHEVKTCLRKFGVFLAKFHSRYGLQHGDCQPANIFFDQASDRFSLIDVAEMGNAMLKEDDVQHFVGSMRKLTSKYGSHVCEDNLAHFERGYGDANSS